MLLKPTEYQRCRSCKSTKGIKSEAVYGCDSCRKKIALEWKGGEHLDITVHFKQGESKRFQFCSWKCLVKITARLKTDYFISLPFLSFDGAPKGQRPEDFFRLVAGGKR